jgi:hypothetical protein
MADPGRPVVACIADEHIGHAHRPALVGPLAAITEMAMVVDFTARKPTRAARPAAAMPHLRRALDNNANNSVT